MLNPEANIKTILKQIRAKENGPAVDAMDRMGLKYNRNFGVSLSDLRIIADKYKPNHGLAEILRNKNIRETRILAEMVEDPKMMTKESAGKIVSKIDTNELAEQSCINLFEKMDFVDMLVNDWINSEHDFTVVSGFILFSRIALTDKQKNDNFFKNPVILSENLAHNKNVFIRKAVARALRQIALRNDNLKKQVLNITDIIKENQTEYSKLVIEEVVPLIDYQSLN